MPVQKAACLDDQITNDPTFIVDKEVHYAPDVAIGSTYPVMLEIFQAPQHGYSSPLNQAAQLVPRLSSRQSPSNINSCFMSHRHGNAPHDAYEYGVVSSPRLTITPKFGMRNTQVQVHDIRNLQRVFAARKGLRVKVKRVDHSTHLPPLAPSLSRGSTITDRYVRGAK